MEAVFDEFQLAFQTQNGYQLASSITPYPVDADPNRLRRFFSDSDAQDVETDVRYATVYNSRLQISKNEKNAWLEVLIAFWKAAGEIIAAEDSIKQSDVKATQWGNAYEAWKGVVNALIKGYSGSHFEAWTVPCLYVAGKYLRTFAIQADKHAPKNKETVSFDATFQDDVADTLEENETLKDAARQINRIFSLCVNDRAPIEESRKWALYYTVNLLFKTYFKLNSISLSKNILRTLQASTTDMPPLHAFPKSHIVTFQYYAGVIAFLEEDYAKAEIPLTEAYYLCHRAALKNRELILTYLIPCRLIQNYKLPSQHLLSPFPRLKRLFTPLCTCIKRGDLAGFDAALAAGQDEFVKRRIYLTLERCRDIAMRNLFRKVFLAGGFLDEQGAPVAADGGGGGEKVRRTRVPVHEFAAALHLGLGQKDGEELDRDEVECFIANLIYKGFMKGYISRERAMVVLSKGGQAFPSTGV